LVIQIALPRLNGLVPSVESTFRKLVEEQGELSEAILIWREQQGTPYARKALHEVAAELIDVAQTCISLTFVLESAVALDLQDLLDDHLEKLRRKNYLNEEIRREQVIFHVTEDGYRVMSLPRLVIPGVTLDSTVLNISMAVGRFAQWIGKFSGASGEKVENSQHEIDLGCGLNLLHIAQCCFTMLYILQETYLMDTDQLVADHLLKLKQRGYIK